MPARRDTPWTADELALIERQRQHWLAVGTNTERADIPAVQAAWAALYRRDGRNPVPVWVVPGPVAAHAALALWRNRSLGDSLGDSLYASLGDSLGASLDDSLGDSLGASLDDSLWDSLGASLYASLWDSLGDSLYASLRDSLGDSLRASLGDSLGDSLGASLYASLWASLWASLGDSLYASLRASLGDSLRASLRYEPTPWWGAYDAYWVGWYRCAQALGVAFTEEQDARLGEMEALTRSALWSWPCEHGVVVCDRPSVCRTEEAQPGRWRFHAPDGPAVAFRDGYELYAIRGVRVPRAVVMEPETITVAMVNGEENQEVRRIMLDRLGMERYVRESHAKQLDASDYGTLWQVPAIHAGDEPLTVVEVVNGTPEPDGTHRSYLLSVPPTMERAREAVAWTYGLDERDYAPEART